MSETLSIFQVFKLGTDSELPYRMALQSQGDGLICAMETPKVCRSLLLITSFLNICIEFISRCKSVSNVLDERTWTSSSIHDVEVMLG